MAILLAGAAAAFDAVLCADLARLGKQIHSRLDRLDAAFRRRARQRGYDALQVRALTAIAPGEALRFFAAGRPPEDFFEQVEYNGRRLAKLNLPPQEVLEALAAYELPAPEPFRPALERLKLGVALELNAAFYQVREAETQVFYGLFRAEMDAESLDQLLQRSVEILTRALRAQAGRLVPLENAEVAPTVLARLSRPVYVEAGARNRFLMLDASWHGRYACCWSYPFREAGTVAAIAQFGFSKPYTWLPRELTLLEAAAERSMAAVRRARLLRDLAASEAKVRQLAAHLIRAGEEERRRISRELHDEAGQTLVMLGLELEKLAKSTPPELRGAVREAREMTARSIEEVRRAVAALSPAVIERLGLEAALRQLVARFSRASAAKVRLSVAALPLVPEETAAVVYRLVQECCQNVVKHSGASRVNLSLRPSDSCLELSVTDNGSGFDVHAALQKPDAFGLAGMRERVGLLGGQLDVRSREGRGSVVAARIPLRPAAPAGKA